MLHKKGVVGKKMLHKKGVAEKKNKTKQNKKETNKQKQKQNKQKQTKKQNKILKNPWAEVIPKIALDECEFVCIGHLLGAVPLRHYGWVDNVK